MFALCFPTRFTWCPTVAIWHERERPSGCQPLSTMAAPRATFIAIIILLMLGAVAMDYGGGQWSGEEGWRRIDGEGWTWSPGHGTRTDDRGEGWRSGGWHGESSSGSGSGWRASGPEPPAPHFRWVIVSCVRLRYHRFVSIRFASPCLGSLTFAFLRVRSSCIAPIPPVNLTIALASKGRPRFVQPAADHQTDAQRAHRWHEVRRRGFGGGGER